MPTVAFSRRLDDWIVRGERRKAGVNGELVLFRDELPQIAVVDLRNALANNAAFYDTDPCDAEVSDVPEGYFDPEDGGGPIGFELVGRELLISIMHFADWPADSDEHAAIDKVRELVTPFLDHRGAKLHSVEVEDIWSNDMALAFRIRVATPWRGRSAAELLEVGDATLRLCDSFSSSAIDRDSVADLVRGGCAELLIGQPEGNWLDAKAEEYDLRTTRGKISLTQAVSLSAMGKTADSSSSVPRRRRSQAAKRSGRCAESSPSTRTPSPAINGSSTSTYTHQSWACALTSCRPRRTDPSSPSTYLPSPRSSSRSLFTVPSPPMVRPRGRLSVSSSDAARAAFLLQRQ
jgi:hypothetical protein